MTLVQSGTDNNLIPSALSLETINIICVDSTYCYLFFNNVHKEAVRKTWGVDISVGTSLLEVIPESAERTAVKHNLDRALDGESFVEIKEHGDIEKHQWESIYSPMYNPGGDIIGVTVNSIAITECKDAEREVEERNKQIDNLLKNMTEGYSLCEIIYDKENIPYDYRILEVNKAYEEQCGIKGSDIVGKTILEFFPDIEKSWIEIYGEVGLTQKTQKIINYNHNTKRYYEVTAYSPKKGLCALLFKDTSELRQQVGALEQEISDRKEAENALKESEEMFRALFEQAGGYCMVLQPTDSGIPVIIDANKAACLEHGYTRHEMIGRPVSDLDDEEGKKKSADRTKLILSGKPLSIEAEHIRKDGSSFPVSIYANRIQIGNKPPLILTTEHNLSDIRIAEAERKRAEDAARQHLVDLAHVARLATMGEMATGIAHELNQPLTAINTFASVGLKLMQRGNKEPQMQIDAMKSISSQAMRAGDIIRRLRGFVQKESPKMMQADLNILIAEVMILLEPEINKQDIKFQLKLAEQLPKITVSGIEIQQVLVNLIQNAVDAMQDSPTDLRKLVISTNQPNQTKIVATVTDTGHGMDEATLSQIFKAFFTTKGNDGIGVGLSISHSIIKAHGGTLSVQSQPDEGCSFSFTLPTNDNQMESNLRQQHWMY